MPRVRARAAAFPRGSGAPLSGWWNFMGLGAVAKHGTEQRLKLDLPREGMTGIVIATGNDRSPNST
jgi:hypothetical protein